MPRLDWVLAGVALALVACGSNQTRSEDEAPASSRPAAASDEATREGGDPEPPAPAEPTVVIAARDEDHATLVVGDEHSCAIDESRVYCWGANASGQLGDGTTTSRPSARPVSGVAAVEALAAGASHTCALSEGKVHCWGSADWVRASAPPRRTTPSAVAGITDAAGIAAGGRTTCVRRATGEVVCFDGSRALEPVALPARALAVQLGSDHGCARLEGGRIACWGSNVFGQTASTDANATGVVEPRLEAVARIATGSAHSCALVQSGGVYCWGDHRPDRRYDQTLAPPALRAEAATEIVAGGLYTCITADGATGCREVVQERVWPSGARGHAIVQRVELPPGTTEVALGSGHRCVRAAGRVICWGNGGEGQCGARAAYVESPAEIALPRAGTGR